MESMQMIHQHTCAFNDWAVCVCVCVRVCVCVCRPPSLQQAIEGFALMVKKTAQSLQVFGMELAETELPGDIQTTTSLLGTHTSKKDRMKVTPPSLSVPLSPFSLSLSLSLYLSRTQPVYLKLAFLE